MAPEDNGTKNEDSTPSRKEPRVKSEHITLASVLSALLVGGGGFFSFKDLSARQDIQTAKLEAIQITLTEIKTKDQATGAVMSQLLAENKELRDRIQTLRDTAADYKVQVNDHERRLAVLEGRK